MRIRSFLSNLLLIAYLAFPLSACSKITPSLHPPADHLETDTPSPFPEVTLPSESEILPPVPIPLPEPPSDVWNVENVDISHVDRHRKLIAFTFDDAPGRTFEELLVVFASFNEKNPECKAHATVFFNGNRFDNATPPILHAATALGFELGNHSFSHADMTKLSNAEIIREIEKTDELLFPIDKKNYHLFRAPYGRVNERLKALVKTPLIDWTIDTLDWTGNSENDIYKTVWNNRFSGAIVLMHDGYEHTVSALKRLLPDLKADGYQVVSVSELSKAHACPLHRAGVYIRARKSGEA